MIKRIMNLKLVKLINFIREDFEKTDFSGICTQMSFYLLLAFFPPPAFSDFIYRKFYQTL